LHSKSSLSSSHSVTCQLNDRQSIILETGKLAFMADGAVSLKVGDTVMLATCCAPEIDKPTADFLPLTVDFEEKMYSIGSIPSTHMRREAKPSEKAILTSRLIDRPLRSMFPKGYYSPVQLVITLLSADQAGVSYEPLAIMAASASACLAGLPLHSAVGAVRVGLRDGEFLLNPNDAQIKESSLDLVVAGTAKSILMLEAGAKFIKEETLLAALKFAQKYIDIQIKAQEELLKLCKVQIREFASPEEDKELKQLVEKIAKDELQQSIQSALTDKKKYDKLIDQVHRSIREYSQNNPTEIPEEKLSLALGYSKQLEKELMRSQIMRTGRRVDGRECNEIRPIWSETGILPRVHGSAIFTRGSTQTLSTVTLGSNLDAKPIDGISEDKTQTYYHNYNFPPFSVGEAKPMRGPGRREMGHGALAERALVPAIPSKEEFPYVIRVVSDILSSNGSTSMASVCGSTLALMDAGVPISDPISGIAMGLILEKDQCAILSDIQGIEDFLGDMDFKVAGSREGITAIQLDLKLAQGIKIEILEVALKQALIGRLHILDKIQQTLSSPKDQLSLHAPRFEVLQIETSEIGLLIGPGGKNIKKIVEQSNSRIDISDNGEVAIQGSIEALEKAKSMIGEIVFKPEVGKEYRGKVVKKLPMGTLIEIGSGKVGMFRGPREGEAQDIPELSEGQYVHVTLKDIDQRRGRMSLVNLRVVD